MFVEYLVFVEHLEVSTSDPVALVEHRVFIEHRVLEELASDPVTPSEHQAFVEKRVFVKYLIFVEHRV